MELDGFQVAKNRKHGTSNGGKTAPTLALELQQDACGGHMGSSNMQKGTDGERRGKGGHTVTGTVTQ